MRRARFQTGRPSSRIDSTLDGRHFLSADQKKNIVIIGASGHAKVIIDIVRQEGRFNIAGLLDQSKETGERVLGCPVLGKEENLPELIKSHALVGAIIAIGDNSVRSNVADRIRKISPELQFVSAVHPRASIATDVSIGEGTVVMAGALIGPSASIGRFCILNTNCSLDHDCVLQDFASLAPRAATGGNCRIGEYSAICIGAVLVHGINIGEHSVVGAGSLVMKDLETFVVAYGTPAKVIRTRNPGDKYLGKRPWAAGQVFRCAHLFTASSLPAKGRGESVVLEKTAAGISAVRSGRKKALSNSG